ncbi:MAG: D-alanine--D-alanine ligase, partial [Lachnospiraceae bacterium]|nr:D-alanine--D-alanine ligase [Lachnospiraceae bacterium]
MKIVVLCGGTSTERAISISSGLGVCKALRSKGHLAILVDVFFGDPNVNLMHAFPEEYDPDAEAEHIHAHDGLVKSSVSNPNRTFFGPNVIKLCKMSDIVFLALHGANGEDGRIQAVFDLNRIRYTGSGYMGSALAMDKNITKILLRANGIPVPDGYLQKKNAPVREPSDHGLVFPVMVKVCRGGSSVGAYLAHDLDEFKKALEDCFSYEDEAIIEEYIEGREFSVGVIEGE